MKNLDKIKEKARTWLAPIYDKKTRMEVKKLLKHKIKCYDAFYQGLAFGTGGVRGEMGVGTNRINLYTLLVISQGVLYYLRKKNPRTKLKIAVAYDTRKNSKKFAKEIGKFFSQNNLTVYLFSKPQPTPLLSFAVRELKCHLGIVITASHNPKEYNGYKVYNRSGGQIVEPMDKEITKEINQVGSYSMVKAIAKRPLFSGKENKKKQLLILDSALEKKYFKTISSILTKKALLKKEKVCFSPLHGTGINLLPPLLEHLGIEKIVLVASQAKPDGNFPTVKTPNPEELTSKQLGIKKLKSITQQLLFLTDPDGDRLGVVIKASKEKTTKDNFFIPNGNQIGVLLLNYLIELKKKDQALTNYYLVSTVVSSPLIFDLARKHKITSFSTLTGFKYIGKMIEENQKNKYPKKFLLGIEESYGYLITDRVRDKDAISAAALFAEMFFYYQKKSLTLEQVLQGIYCQHGYYLEDLFSLIREGEEGKKFIARLINNLRESPPRSIVGVNIVEIIDYQKQIRYRKGKQKKFNFNFPTTNLLQFLFCDETLISVRPSGTEPKIKFYITVKEKVEFNNFSEVEKRLKERISSYKNFFIKKGEKR